VIGFVGKISPFGSSKPLIFGASFGVPIQHQNFGFEFHEPLGRVFVRMSGVVDGARVVSAITNVFSDERWQHHFDIVWDLSHASELLFEWSDYENWLEFHKEAGSQVVNGKCLILVSSDLHETILNVYAQLARKSPRPVFIFRAHHELETALAKSC
jgi:hypothetical protein